MWRTPTIRGKIAALLLIAAVAGQADHAQRSNAPHLLRRSTAWQNTSEPDSIFRPGRSDLPEEAAGAYALSEDPGEVIEMILNGSGNDCRLQGYVTRIADGASDRGASLTFFFVRTTVAPAQLTFSTRQVHGLWWSFAGQIMPGNAPSSRKGAFFLNGTLTEHFDTGQSQAQRVSLPLLPEGR